MKPALLLGLLACFGFATTGPASALAQKAPDFALKDLRGHTVHLSDYRGKVVLVNFWATWCPPCRFEIPAMVKVYDGLKKKGFVILGLSLDDDPVRAVPGFLRKFKSDNHFPISYPILVGDERVADAYGGIRGIPTTFLVDRKGVVRRKYIGPPATSEQAIESALKAEVSRLL